MSRAVVAVGVLLGSLAAQAQEPGGGGGRGQGWSVLAGQTVGIYENVLVADVGWPGLSLGFLRGVTPRLDVGLRASGVYSEQRLVSYTETGVRLQGWLRYSLLDTGRFNLGVSLMPGGFISFRPDDTLGGVELPVGLALGIPVGSALMWHFGLDVPLFATFGERGGVVVPVLVGGGAEYFLNRRLAATFTTRMGPAITSDEGVRYHDGSDFALEVLLGVAYRL